VSIAEEAVRDEEAGALFRGLEGLPGFVIAVSGGPDSTALLVLAAQWVKRQKNRPPKLLAITIDHGLRPQAAAEAAAVKRLARRLGVPHRTLRWRGKKPKSGLQEAARIARYRLLARAATRVGYGHVMTAHTLDDQAETVLFRLARGSGLTGLGGMATASPLPAGSSEIFLLRPLLHVPKSRLVATLGAAGIAYAEDPSNSDPRFTRARLRALMPALAGEGLDARGLARLAARMRRAEATVEFAVHAAQRALAPGPWRGRDPVVVESARFARLPAEVGLRLLGRAIAHAGYEGPVELGKLEVLYEALRQAPGRLRQTLAGAVVTLAGNTLKIDRAPARRNAAMRRISKRRFTK
jgi:tRNA(Ile)-lysidine synthase